jgi:hypothetical protein
MANFFYNFSVTGDCTNNNSGAIDIFLSGGVAPYTIDWVTPNIGTGNLKTSLSGGTYIVRANDSLGDVNNEFYINIIVSSGGCLTVSSITGTTCGENNGQVSITGASTAYPITIKILSGSTEVVTGITYNGELLFTDVPSGVFRAYYEDYGGCSGYSESFIVQPSSPLDWGFYVVNDTLCNGNVGKLQITGLTGTPPYTYLWSDGSSGTTLTGLTADTYSVTITDFYGCEKTKSATVENADPLEIFVISGTSPSCFSSDGTATLKVTGGTGPYFFSGSNGTNLVTYATEITFTGLPPGTSYFTVTDSTLCSTISSISLQAESGFSLVSLNVQNSTCSTNGGSVNVNLNGNGPFTYTLIYPDSSSEVVVQTTPTITYNNLDDGEYTLVIENASGCQYSTTFNIYTSDKFSVTTSVSGTSCGFNNGICQVDVGTGYTGVLDFIVTKDNVAIVQYIDVTFSSVTFNNLSSGIYKLQVRDADNCSIYRDFTITSSNSLDFILVPTSCGNLNNEGTITTTILNGTPPFTYLWSENTGYQNTQNLSGLSGDTYTLTITDYSGCTRTESVVVPCTPLVSGYIYLPVISTGFTVTKNSERDFESMVSEGFNDLTSGNTNCVLSSAIYTAFVEISGNTYEQEFFTGTTLSGVPTEAQWIESLESILSGVTGVSTYTFDTINNTVTVKSTCDGTEDELQDSEFIIGLTIDYDIYCET